MTSPQSPAKMKSKLSSLPPYRRPQTGILGLAPDTLLPYLQLMRVDKPGAVLCLLVHYVGVLHAGVVLGLSPLRILSVCLYLFIPAHVLMWANFAWNDIVDREIDGKVARSRHRPLVRGAMSLRSAVATVALLVVAMLAFLVPLPPACFAYALLGALGGAVYPYSKRWGNYPHLFLALVSPYMVFVGASAAGETPFPYPRELTIDGVLSLSSWAFPQDDGGRVSLLLLYAALAVWTVSFELIYSYQDAEWDREADIGTMTRLFASHESAKTFLVGLAVLQTALFEASGLVMVANMWLWSMASVLVLGSLILQIRSVDLADESSCIRWFGLGLITTGLATLLGPFGEYCVRFY